MEIRPRPLHGAWDEGHVLDLHMSSSVFIGYSDSGHPEFDSTRTELGESLYRLKYQKDQAMLGPITKAVCAFIESWNPKADLLVPAPPSKHRAVQPLYQIADAVGVALGLPVDKKSVQKAKATPEVKNLDSQERLDRIKGAFRLYGDGLKGKRILLLDDLYQTGATMNTLARLLKNSGGASAVYALVLTRTRG
jgi:competence protein ComFC